MQLPPPITTLFPYTTLFRSLNPLPQAGLNQGFSGVSVNPAPLPSRLARAASGESGKPCAVMRYLPLAAHPYCLLRSEEHTSELQSRENIVARLLHEKKKRTR